MTTRTSFARNSIMIASLLAAAPIFSGPALSPGWAVAHAASGGNGGGNNGGGGGNGGGNNGGNGGNNGGNSGNNGNAGNSNAGNSNGAANSAEQASRGNGNGGKSGGTSAGGGNAKGHAGEKGTASSGQMSSALGALNAAHASPNALNHASSNSRVGHIATYDKAMVTALAMPTNTPVAIAAQTAAISAARTQLAASSNKTLTPEVVTKVDGYLGLGSSDPRIGTSM